MRTSITFDRRTPDGRCIQDLVNALRRFEDIETHNVCGSEVIMERGGWYSENPQQVIAVLQTMASSCGCRIDDDTVDTDKNHLPAELAAQLLERDPADDGRDMPTDAERELLTILVEECAEVVQAATKVLRFGKGMNPWTKRTTISDLDMELGDVVTAQRMLQAYKVIDNDAIEARVEEKLNAFKTSKTGRLRYAKVPSALRTR